MSTNIKAEAFDLAIELLFQCRDYIKKSYSGTPGREEILERIRIFEEYLAEEFSKGETHA